MRISASPLIFLLCPYNYVHNASLFSLAHFSHKHKKSFPYNVSPQISLSPQSVLPPLAWTNLHRVRLACPECVHILHASALTSINTRTGPASSSMFTRFLMWCPDSVVVTPRSHHCPYGSTWQSYWTSSGVGESQTWAKDSWSKLRVQTLSCMTWPKAVPFYSILYLKMSPEWLEEYLLCLQQCAACCFERPKIWAKSLKEKYLWNTKNLQ